MSSLIIQVCKIDHITPHPDADRMEVARIKGWDVCIGKGHFKPGDKCVYFPPDCVLPTALADRLGITKYLTPNKTDGVVTGGRVRVANLRGFKSYGTIMPCENAEWEVGTDVAEHYGITKWEPPLECQDGDAERPHPAFHRYFDMENIRNFPDLFQPGDDVVITEKIHGQNCRLGLIRDTNEQGEAIWRWMAGSHDVRRKRWYQKMKQDRNEETNEPIGEPYPVGDPIESAFWQCFTPAVRAFMAEESGCGYTPEELDTEPPVKNLENEANIVLFGERYGSGVQDMAYGFENGRFGFRVFDYTVNGQYVDFEYKQSAFAHYGVEMVPVLYRGPFDFAKVEALSEGPTTICEVNKAGKFTGREGVVVLSVAEKKSVTPEKVFERTQLKCINFAYLSRKDGTEYH
jgi:hypothetical protein